MQKAGRIALIITGVVCALLAVALLAVNLYVQSAHTQARIQDELSQRLGATLRIQRISVTPWWGLKLTGITMPQDDAGTGNFLEAETFGLRVEIGSLFSQRLVIKEVLLIKPTVVWVQNADGKWRLPATEAEREPSATTDFASPTAAELPPPGQVPPAAGTAAAPPVAATPFDSTLAPAPARAEESGRFTPEVRRVRLVDGDFRFLDEKKQLVASFEDVRFRSTFRNATALTGTASIARISLRDRFFLEHLQSPLTYDPEALEFSEITAEAAGGEIMGRFQMSPANPESPFQVAVQFRDLDADRLISDAHGPAGMLRGQIEGFLKASGKTADPNALSGTGEIRLRDGQVRQYSLLVALGQLLQIEELKQMRFNQARVRYHIDPGVVTVDDLLLSSANMRLAATGTISFEGQLQLEARLAIDDSIRSQLFRPIRDNFAPTPEAGFSAVAFHVSGTLERPRSDLMDKLVGRELRDLSSVISGFLGGKSERGKRKRSPEPPAAAAPAPPLAATPAPVEIPERPEPPPVVSPSPPPP